MVVVEAGGAAAPLPDGAHGDVLDGAWFRGTQGVSRGSGQSVTGVCRVDCPGPLHFGRHGWKLPRPPTSGRPGGVTRAEAAAEHPG